MSGIFPNTDDGGLPPNAADLSNPKAAYPPVTPPLNTSALYYGNGCDVRLRPEVINSLISEIEATVDQANVSYDVTRRENMELAIRYLIQRGIQTGGIAYGGPADYTMTLDPPVTHYNNHITFVVVPLVENNGPVRININGRGLVPVLRNDFTNLMAGDWVAGVPTLISYWNGAFYNPGGLYKSQLPKGPLETQVDLWVNNAFGSDDPSHSGLTNTPADALLTFQRAINIAFNYQPGPFPVVIHIMNGTGAAYKGGYTPQYSGPSLIIVGESANTLLDDPYYCFSISGPNNGHISNISIQSTAGVAANGGCITVGNGASLITDNIHYRGGLAPAIQSYGGSLTAYRATFYASTYACYYVNFGGNIGFNGDSLIPGANTQTVAAAIYVALTTANVTANGSIGVAGGNTPWVNPGFVTGTKYIVSSNGTINDQVGDEINSWFPGSGPGQKSFGGEYV
jgi:hypothetical protein